jgi:hypothetical protein
LSWERVTLVACNWWRVVAVGGEASPKGRRENKRKKSGAAINKKALRFGFCFYFAIFFSFSCCYIYIYDIAFFSAFYKGGTKTKQKAL